jgi:sec-independent protein translocase protein TatA
LCAIDARAKTNRYPWQKTEARSHSGLEEIMFEGIMQPMHLLVILVIALLFFGPSKLGDLGKGLGDGIRHFKNAMKDGSEPAAPATPAATAAPEEKLEQK